MGLPSKGVKYALDGIGQVSMRGIISCDYVRFPMSRVHDSLLPPSILSPLPPADYNT